MLKLNFKELLQKAIPKKKVSSEKAAMDQTSQFGPMTSGGATKLSYSLDLIEGLTADHKSLVATFVAALQAADTGDARTVSAQLSKFHADLREHLRKEETKLYIYLKQNLPAADVDQVQAMRTEMTGIAKVVVAFLNKYEKVSPSQLAAFKEEAKGIADALLDRIKREEEQLYPAYAALASGAGGLQPLQFHSDLIAGLSADHNSLVNTFVSAMTAADSGDAQKVAKLLQSFHADLRNHLNKEETKLYIYLKQNLPADKAAMVQSMRTEMTGIAKVVVSFLKKYEGLSSAQLGEFKSEAKGIADALLARIKAEEETLYPLYVQQTAAPKASTQTTLSEDEAYDQNTNYARLLKFKIKPLPLIGRLDPSVQNLFLAGMSATFALLTATIVYIGSIEGEHMVARSTAGVKLSYLSQRLQNDVRAAISGSSDAFISLADSIKQFKINLDLFVVGSNRIPKDDGAFVADHIEPVKFHYDAGVSKLPQFLKLGGSITKLSGEHIPSVVEKLQMSADWLEKAASVVAQENGAWGNSQVFADLSAATAVLSRTSANILASTGTANFDAPAMLKIKNDLTGLDSQFATLLREGHVSSSDARSFIQLARSIAVPVATEYLDTLAPLLDDVQKVKSKALESGANWRDADTILQVTNSTLDRRISDLSHYNYMAVIFGFAALYFGAMWTVFNSRQNRLATEEQKEKSDRTTAAIETLMFEIADISNGDLTKRATVTEDDLTGTIADAFNMTISRLRKLIGEVQDASSLVAGASHETIETATEVRKTAQSQQVQMTEASNSVLKVVESINEVSSKVTQTAVVASDSLQVANDGKLAVDGSVAAMEDIRTLIQEASKRLKRVGESSQEITSIAYAISDITEQTNVLALNANVQAAAAGEAGRSFAAVAAEVQRLAVRSEQWLKKITAIVDSVQSETKEAIAAMERTTGRVVEGSEITKQAGVALDQIGRVADQMASLVSEINKLTTDQTAEAAQISERIKDVVSLTNETTEMMTATVIDIQKIDAMADVLNKSTVGFKVA